MKRILSIGIDPYTLDFPLPGFPPGFDADTIDRGMKSEKAKLDAQGYPTDIYLIDSKNWDLQPLEQLLQTTPFAAIVIGAGIRVMPAYFLLFEKLINCLHEHAPTARIVFNTNPTDSAEAVGRWV